MRVKYRGIWVLDLLFLIAFIALVMLAYSCYAAGDAGNGTGFLMVALFLAAADAIHYFHGLWITPKKCDCLLIGWFISNSVCAGEQDYGNF